MAFVVRRAIAVGGQLIRVVFASEPKHASTAGLDDARNASNYQVEVVTGNGTTPQSIGVLSDVATFPAYGVINAGEVGINVQLDRPVVVGLSYRVTCSQALRSAASLALGAPYSADFVGAQRPAMVRQMRRKPSLVDFATDPFQGGIIVDSSGDWATHDGLPGTKKRILRRALTKRNSFVCLPGYGLDYDFKVPCTTNKLTSLRTDLSQQIQQEPDVVDSQTGATLDARGLLYLTIKAKTTQGQDVDAGIQSTSDGGITTS